MQINSAMSYGLQGLNRGQQQVEQGSRELASLATRPQEINPVESAVTLQTGLIQSEASAKVVKSADEMMGTLIDIRV